MLHQLKKRGKRLLEEPSSEWEVGSAIRISAVLKTGPYLYKATQYPPLVAQFFPQRLPLAPHLPAIPIEQRSHMHSQSTRAPGHGPAISPRAKSLSSSPGIAFFDRSIINLLLVYEMPEAAQYDLDSIYLLPVGYYGTYAPHLLTKTKCFTRVPLLLSSRLS
jgi:hypothetical protein